MDRGKQPATERQGCFISRDRRCRTSAYNELRRYSSRDDARNHVSVVSSRFGALNGRVDSATWTSARRRAYELGAPCRARVRGRKPSLFSSCPCESSARRAMGRIGTVLPRRLRRSWDRAPRRSPPGVQKLAHVRNPGRRDALFRMHLTDCSLFEHRQRTSAPLRVDFARWRAAIRTHALAFRASRGGASPIRRPRGRALHVGP